MTTRTDPGFHCASCEARITTAPVIHLGLAFCCAGCAADGPCICSYDAEPADSGDDALVEVVAA
jgi:hypothetical protein